MLVVEVVVVMVQVKHLEHKAVEMELEVHLLLVVQQLLRQELLTLVAVVVAEDKIQHPVVEKVQQEDQEL
tara:strand:+ start:446 stop:655 length:210 start_codon:yes stop_codon:yes gene_type:complete